MTRKDNIYKLNKLRKAGWEKHILPYGIKFNEEKATDTQLQNHLNKILNYRDSVIHYRISLALRLVAILMIITIVILKFLQKK